MPEPVFLKTTQVYRLPHLRFHANAIEFCQLVKDIVLNAQHSGVPCPVSELVIDMGQEIIANSDSKAIIEIFIERSAVYWQSIQRQDIEFFRTKGLEVFNGIPQSQIQAFNRLFDLSDAKGRAVIDDVTLEAVWSFFHSFVKIAVCHIHLQRQPDPVTKKYTQTYFPEISIRNEVTRWGLRELQ